MASVGLVLLPVAFGSLLIPPTPAATTGVLAINHSAALAGGVTPGDAPGYPVTLSLPGSYRLASNLSQPDVDTNVIDIRANDVTIDLNGFAIQGMNECRWSIGEMPNVVCSNPGKGHGIFLEYANLGIGTADHYNIAVHNGSIHGTGSSGIFLKGVGTRVDHVSASHCGGDGISLRNGTISQTTATRNMGNGIFLLNGTLSDSMATQNGMFGVTATSSTVRHTHSSWNAQHGFFVTMGTAIGNTAIHNGKADLYGERSYFGGNTCGGVACP